MMQMQKSLSIPLRGELVRAAETVLDKQGGLPRNPENSQLSRLVQVTGEAACADEIANYLRYQGARGRWKRSLAEDVIDAIHPLLGALGSESERVAAWRLYATFLRRSYYYRREVNRDMERSRRKDGPPHRGGQSQPPAREPQHAGREEAAGEGTGKRRRQRRRGKRPGAPGEAGAAEALEVADASGELAAEHVSSEPEAAAEYSAHDTAESHDFAQAQSQDAHEHGTPDEPAESPGDRGPEEPQS